MYSLCYPCVSSAVATTSSVCTACRTLQTCQDTACQMNAACAMCTAAKVEHNSQTTTAGAHSSKKNKLPFMCTMDMGPCVPEEAN